MKKLRLNLSLVLATLFLLSSLPALAEGLACALPHPAVGCAKRCGHGAGTGLRQDCCKGSSKRATLAVAAPGFRLKAVDLGPFGILGAGLAQLPSGLPGFGSHGHWQFPGNPFLRFRHPYANAPPIPI